MKNKKEHPNRDHARSQCAACHAWVGLNGKRSAQLLHCSDKIPKRVKKELGIKSRSKAEQSKDYAKRKCAKCHAVLGFGYKLSARLLGCSIGIPKMVKRELGIAPATAKASWGVLRGREVLGLTAPHHIERLQREAFESETIAVRRSDSAWGRVGFSDGMYAGHEELNRFLANKTATATYHRNKNNAEFIASKRMRYSVWKHVKSKHVSSLRTEELMGCTFDEFRRHIENQFDLGMCWDNHGKWHIDHIRPCSSFDLTDPQQAKQCFHYTNLRPLPASENRSKNSKWKGKYIRKPRFQREMAKNAQNPTNGTFDRA